MVTEFGMSDKLGRVRYNANEQEVFLGHSVTQTQNVSEATSQLIDSEVRRLIEEAEAKARKVLTERMDDLHAIAKGVQTLLRGEKIVRDDSGGAGPSTGPKPRRASVPTSRPTPNEGGDPAPQPGG